MKQLILATAFAVTTFTAANAEVMGWKGDVNLGGSLSEGNTEETRFHGHVDAKRNFDAWALVFDAKADFREGETDREAEKYSAGIEGQRKLDDVSYLFAGIDWENDNFSGYESIYDLTVGYGRKLYATERTKLDGKIGIGYRMSETEGGVENEEMVITPELMFEHKISSAVTFTQKLKASIGDELTVTEANSKLASKMSDNLSLNVTYDITNKDSVPAGFEETDSKLGVGVGYAF